MFVIEYLKHRLGISGRSKQPVVVRRDAGRPILEHLGDAGMTTRAWIEWGEGHPTSFPDAAAKLAGALTNGGEIVILEPTHICVRQPASLSGFRAEHSWAGEAFDMHRLQRVIELHQAGHDVSLLSAVQGSDVDYQRWVTDRVLVS